MNPANSTPPKQENPFLSIMFNILIPVAVLNQLTKRLGENGPTIALIVALAFPIIYGCMDYYKRKHKNFISLLGIINILFTGGLALLKLEGIWFSVKEAAFPLVIGIGVFVSAFTKKPLMGLIAMNANVMNTQLVENKLNEREAKPRFQSHLKKSTMLLASSFFISAILNFVLASRIFVDIDPSLSDVERSSILNDQIADMTWLSFIVIALPLMIFSMFILWHLINGIRKLTGLEIGEIIPSANPPQSSSS